VSIVGSAFAHVVADTVIADTFVDWGVVLAAGTVGGAAGTFDSEVDLAGIAADIFDSEVDLAVGIVAHIALDLAMNLRRSSHRLGGGGGEGPSSAEEWI
jgi:hypothetical protein